MSKITNNGLTRSGSTW